MITHCNVIIKDEFNQLMFYRHSDGYPSVVIPSLRKFMLWLNRGLIRNNVGQAAGWLIILGNEEYADYCKGNPRVPGDKNSISGWTVGAYEPTLCKHDDYINYLYTIDLTKPSVIVCKDIFNGKIMEYKAVLQKYELRRRSNRSR
jgi:hypothetical protein